MSNLFSRFGSALLSVHFWKPILTILSLGTSIWALFHFVPFHTILWSIAGMIAIVALVAIGLLNYEVHMDNSEGN